jgi:hypothetical protein
MVKIYEVAYSEHTVHHKRFEAASQDEAIALAQKDLEKHSWDVNKAKRWEHGSGEGGHFEVIDELDKEDIMKRIKHNDLLPWFTDDHRDLASSVPEELPEIF